MTTAAAAAAASEMLRHCVRSSVGLINADRVTTRAVCVRSPDLLVLVHLPPSPPPENLRLHPPGHLILSYLTITLA